MRRILLTLLLLPFSCVVLMPVFFVFEAREPSWMTVVQGLWFGLYAVIGALPLMLLLGGPLIALASWRRWWRLWQVMIGGAVLAGALPVALALRVLQDEKLHLWYRLEQFSLVAQWLVGGLIYGLVFWLVAVRNNPSTGLGATSDPKRSASATSSAA